MVFKDTQTRRVRFTDTIFTTNSLTVYITAFNPSLIAGPAVAALAWTIGSRGEVSVSVLRQSLKSLPLHPILSYTHISEVRLSRGSYGPLQSWRIKIVSSHSKYGDVQQSWIRPNEGALMWRYESKRNSRVNSESLWKPRKSSLPPPVSVHHREVNR